MNLVFPDLFFFLIVTTCSTVERFFSVSVTSAVTFSSVFILIFPATMGSSLTLYGRLSHYTDLVSFFDQQRFSVSCSKSNAVPIFHGTARPRVGAVPPFSLSSLSRSLHKLCPTTINRNLRMYAWLF